MKSNSISRIILKNTFTLFNLVNIILAAMVAFVGSYKNMLFIFIALANTLISIINEVRAKKIIDKMRLIAEQNPTVLRDGKSFQIKPELVEKGDIVVLSLGDQVMFDSVVIEGALEVNESFITGEADNITKHQGDELMSGSFVVAGTAKARVEHVGEENSLTKIQASATTIKTADSKLFKLMNNIVKYISIALIPIGALLLWARFRTEADTTAAVTSTVAALINMIPEGLILLTSTVLALATIRLSKRKVLVQDLYSIETLARVDCICLDKTGTLTTGNMKVKDVIPAENADEKGIFDALEHILAYLPADNATSRALKAEFGRGTKKEATGDYELIPFSSDRKYSGVRIGKTDYLIGALDFMTDDKDYLKQGRKLKGIYRVLAVMKNQKLLGFVRLEDEIRSDAPEIVDYFYKNDVDIRIISGDDLATVENIAAIVGMKVIRGIDLSTIKSPNYRKLVDEYNIFTRVKPAEKKDLIKALRKAGKTVAMTGDGVNDILAMKEADCSIAIGEGSDAARRSAKLVLLGSDFSSVPSIIDEGRQSINNLERSTALFLAKTVYASILAVLFVVLPLSYPFTPIEMSLLNFACIGFPAFILALEHNTERIKNRFLKNILQYSFPIGLTVSVAMLALSIAANILSIPRVELTTASVLITFIIDLVLIYWISRPLNLLRGGLFLSIIAIVAGAFFIPLIRNFFEFVSLSENTLITAVSITAASIVIFEIMKNVMGLVAPKILKKA
ncbi:cation-translocating P-type ATPase [Candidatus Saccharibacteria bacterium]|nr:cation-translocating P-type ATPase [Candidatus Saccharibacteria bacterium]